MWHVACCVLHAACCPTSKRQRATSNLRRSPMKIRVTLILLATLLLERSALAVKVADITRLGGQRTNVLTGLGLVYGLKGTGDGGDFLPAIKPLASMLGKFADPATVLELQKVQNVALVSITATIPGDGVRDGDKIDVY